MAINPIKSLAGQTAVYGMGTIVPRLLNYMLVPFYTRIFAENIYGQLTELYAYVAFLLVLLTYGMETAFFRFAQKHDTKSVFNSALSAIIITSAFFVALLVLFYEPLAQSIRYTGNPEYVLMIGLIVALDAATAIPFALLRKLNKARRFATIKVLNVALNSSLNFIFYYLFLNGHKKLPFHFLVIRSAFWCGFLLQIWLLACSVYCFCGHSLKVSDSKSAMLLSARC